MNTKILDWLLENDNPAVKYRTQTEILKEKGNIEEVKTWIYSKLPPNFYETPGLWYNYYLTALAECGLTKNDIPDECVKRALDNIDQNFEYGCADFMLLRALVMLGYQDHPFVQKVINNFRLNSLPDHGFLCKRRLNNFLYVPKSCYKANLFGLMFIAECKKKKMNIDFGKPLIEYFLKRNIFYKTSDPSSSILTTSTETFHPFEPMRVGIHNIVESFASLGYGNSPSLEKAWSYLYIYQNDDGKIILHQTLTKSYLPKEKIGKASKWVTFYTLLAESEK